MTRKRSPFLYLMLAILQAAHSAEERLTHLYDWLPVVSARLGNAFGISGGHRMNGDVVPPHPLTG